MHARRKRYNGETEQKSLGGQLLSLSLFIMLLAFFIVLNSKASFEEMKFQPIMQSVALAFSSKIAQDQQDKPSITRSDQMGSEEGDALERLGKLFNAEIATAEVVTNRQRGTMAVRVPRKDFEDAVANIGTRRATSAFGQSFLPMLASILRSDADHPYRMDMTFSLPENPARMQNTQPQAMTEAVKSVAAHAVALERAGLPARLMTVGLRRDDGGRGERDMVEIYIRPHIPYDPRGGAR